MADPIRSHYSLYHLAAGCQWVEKIRQDLEERHGTCFVAIKTPTGVLIVSPEDLRQFYPQLAEQLGEKSPQE
jgi:hypothetical protein